MEGDGGELGAFAVAFGLAMGVEVFGVEIGGGDEILVVGGCFRTWFGIQHYWVYKYNILFGNETSR